MNKYKIENIPIGCVKLNDKNPRFIQDAEFKKLVKSLQDCPQLFDARPLLCSDRTGELIILGGNMRYRAALELQWKTVPVIIMRGLTEAQEKEIIIKDNGAFGEWDLQVLAADWAELPLDEWGGVSDWMAQIDTVTAPELRNGDRAPFQQMTFTLHDEQAEELNAAIKKAKNEGGGQSAVNENSNGNALYFIAQRFNRG